MWRGQVCADACSTDCISASASRSSWHGSLLSLLQWGVQYMACFPSSHAIQINTAYNMHVVACLYKHGAVINHPSLSSNVLDAQLLALKDEGATGIMVGVKSPDNETPATAHPTALASVGSPPFCLTKLLAC